MHGGGSRHRYRARYKAGRGRSVSLDEVTVAEFEGASGAADQGSDGARRAYDGYVARVRESGRHAVRSRQVSERFIRMTERHPDLPRLRLHDLRHTHATVLLEAGVPLVVVAKRLGNSIEVCGNVYQHVNSEMQLDPAEHGAALLANKAL